MAGHSDLLTRVDDRKSSQGRGVSAVGGAHPRPVTHGTHGTHGTRGGTGCPGSREAHPDPGAGGDEGGPWMVPILAPRVPHSFVYACAATLPDSRNQHLTMLIVRRVLPQDVAGTLVLGSVSRYYPTPPPPPPHPPRRRSWGPCPTPVATGPSRPPRPGIRRTRSHIVKRMRRMPRPKNTVPRVRWMHRCVWARRKALLNTPTFLPVWTLYI